MQNSVTIHEKTSSKKPAKIFQSFFQRFRKNNVSEQNSIAEALNEELKKLKEQLDFKETNFKHAEPEYVDVAIMELEATRIKYSITVRKLKKLFPETHSTPIYSKSTFDK
jgi:dynactin complex subunit